MKVCSNYFKILIFVIFLSVIYYLSNKIKEKFNNVTTKTIEDSALRVGGISEITGETTATEIKLLITTNNAKNIIKLNWENENTKYPGIQYYIIRLSQNIGPTIITIKSTKAILYEYVFLDPEINLSYKFSVVGIKNDKLVSGSLNKYKEAILNINGLEQSKLNSSISNIYCNADGSFKLIDPSECTKTNNAETELIEFDEDVHKLLIKDLKKKNNNKIIILIDII